MPLKTQFGEKKKSVSFADPIFTREGDEEYFDALEPPLEPEIYFQTDRISRLNPDNFKRFTEKEKALVLFYNFVPGVEPAIEKHFPHAAILSKNAKHGYGAVDCDIHTGLCISEGILSPPLLKLYSNGYELATAETTNIDQNQINMMVKMTPVLTRPPAVGEKKSKREKFSLKMRKLLSCY